ncbi:hypothetical protein JOD20_003343 [Herpetosiphon giganteus]|nr:hypothetical protein [Herpetosiphon giganteus]
MKSKGKRQKSKVKRQKFNAAAQSCEIMKDEMLTEYNRNNLWRKNIRGIRAIRG